MEVLVSIGRLSAIALTRLAATRVGIFSAGSVSTGTPEK
jgi:hypothetical protein